MEEKDFLITQLDDARAKMGAIVAQMDADTEIYPSWTIKEVLAHITGWDDATITSLRVHAAGDVPDTPASRGITVYNEQTVETRESLRFDQVVREWTLTREELKSVLADLPPSRMAEPLVFPWGQTGTVAQLIGIMAHHEAEHAQEIANLLEL